jgi:hypothetical protein
LHRNFRNAHIEDGTITRQNGQGFRAKTIECLMEMSWKVSAEKRDLLITQVLIGISKRLKCCLAKFYRLAFRISWSISVCRVCGFDSTG